MPNRIIQGIHLQEISPVNQAIELDTQEWMQSYLHACRSRNLATGTIEFYDKKLKAFAAFCLEAAINNINEISTNLIRQFLIRLADTGHTPAGVHCYYRAVKTFLMWYEKEAEPDHWHNPIDKVVAPIVPLEPLDPISMETIKAMLGTCKGGKLHAARDRACFLVLLDTSIRLAEFLSLNLEDVNPFNGMILIRSGKGRKPRNVYLGEKSRLVVRRYVRQRKDHNPALWVSRSGERLTDTGLRMILRRRAAQAGVPSPLPHDFRRAFVVARWRAGMDILTLSKLMGHNSLQVLNRYLKQMGEDLEQAARQSSPVDRYFY